MKGRKRKRPEGEVFYNPASQKAEVKTTPSIPYQVLRDNFSDIGVHYEFGKKIQIQQIDANYVGKHVYQTKTLPIFRIDVWVDWWTFDMQQFPSSRIGKSYYQAYDDSDKKFYDLDKSDKTLLDKLYQESRKNYQDNA